MEVLQNAIEDKLIDGLSYKLDNTASYISERNSSTFWAVGSNEYSPTGVRVIKLLINGDGWLDPSTVKIQFDLQTKDPAPQVLRTLSGGWSFLEGFVSWLIQHSLRTSMRTITYTRCFVIYSHDMFKKILMLKNLDIL